ncbi:Transmembrane_domain-containing protein [Hexamita inflata]|uniref:Transmembrane domain-containing protein n=1 Tax=Hexamita inflata TaxID=28002 RepID=A0AA86UJS8_9EUKA|nr:Transmembrane domain-containing protein [Hexamita inflata]
MKSSCAPPKMTFGAISKSGWIFITVNTLAGSASNLIKKGLAEIPAVPICDGCETQLFNHPYVMALTMFVAELMCGFIYIFDRYVFNKKKYENIIATSTKKKFKWYHTFCFIIPAFCDMCNSGLTNVAIYLSLVSVQSILRNSSIIFVALISFVFQDYRNRFDFPQVAGLVILVSGLITTGVSGIITTDESAINPLMGAGVTILAALCEMCFFMSEEYFLRSLEIPPLLGMANEGLWGCVEMAIALPILCRIDDPFDHGKMEDVKGWWYQLMHSNQLLGLQIGYMCVTMLNNLSGFATTKNASASVRTTFTCIRPLIIWMISMIVSWETLDKVGTPLKITGFALSISGVLIYNNILVCFPYARLKNAEKFMPKYIKRQFLDDLTEIKSLLGNKVFTNDEVEQNEVQQPETSTTIDQTSVSNEVHEDRSSKNML